MGKQNSTCAYRVPSCARKSSDIVGSSEKLGVVFMTFLRSEAIGPLVLLENFRDQFQGSLWLHFLDIAAALSNLVNGSSSVIQEDILIGATWSQIQRLQVFPWFDRVDSKSNPVDGLSRGRLDGPWKVESFAFPGVFSFALYVKSSEEKRALKPTRCWRHSSVRVGARRSTGKGSALWFLFPHAYLGATASDLGSVR